MNVYYTLGGGIYEPSDVLRAMQCAERPTQQSGKP